MASGSTAKSSGKASTAAAPAGRTSTAKTAHASAKQEAAAPAPSNGPGPAIVMTPSAALARHLEWLDFALAAATAEETWRTDRLAKATKRNRVKREERLAEVRAEVAELGALIAGLEDLRKRAVRTTPAATRKRTTRKTTTRRAAGAKATPRALSGTTARGATSGRGRGARAAATPTTATGDDATAAATVSPSPTTTRSRRPRATTDTSAG